MVDALAGNDGRTPAGAGTARRLLRVVPASIRYRGDGDGGGSTSRHEGAVLRARWDGMWREEWAILYRTDGRLSIYAAGSSRPCEKVVMTVVRRIEVLADPDSDADLHCVFAPVPHVLALHTQWRVHYLGFASARACKAWAAQLRAAAPAACDAGLAAAVVTATTGLRGFTTPSQ